MKNITADVVIIGGGISGALNAFHFINAGIQCVLVDGRSIGLGSTCASTSLLQYELDEPLHLLQKKAGNEKATAAYQLCGEAIDKLIELMQQLKFNDYTETKSLFFTNQKKEKDFLQKEYKARKEAGFQIEFLSSSELQNRYGLQAAYGILSNKGATNDAYKLTHEILHYCQTKGLQVYDRTKITEIKNQKGGIELTTEEGFSIQAKYVVNATGYEVTRFIKKGIVNLDCTYAIASEKQEEENTKPGNIMMWNTDQPYLYACFTGHRIIAGGRDERFVNFNSMHRLLQKKSGLLQKDFKKILPTLPFKIEFSWSGVFGKTKDSLPYIGSLKDQPRIFYALGFGGNGITFSLIAAEILTDLICGKKNNYAEIFSFYR